MTRALVLLVAAGLVAGCATAKPVLYSNAKYQQEGQAGANRDIAECKAQADQAGATPGAGKTGQVAKSGGVGAVAGAAGGAVGGAIWGNPGAGAAGGAVSGVVGGVLWPLIAGSNQPSAVHVNYVNQCLVDRGYQIAGWK